MSVYHMQIHVLHTHRFQMDALNESYLALLKEIDACKTFAPPGIYSFSMGKLLSEHSNSGIIWETSEMVGSNNI